MQYLVYVFKQVENIYILHVLSLMKLFHMPLFLNLPKWHDVISSQFGGSLIMIQTFSLPLIICLVSSIRSNWQLISKVKYNQLLNGASSGLLILTPQNRNFYLLIICEKSFTLHLVGANLQWSDSLDVLFLIWSG